MTASFEARYSLRIERARHLRTIHPFAAEILTFYERVCALQQTLAAEIRFAAKIHPIQAGANLRELLDVEVVQPFTGKLLNGVSTAAPKPVAESVLAFVSGSPNSQASALQRYIDHGGKDEAADDSRMELLVRVVIEPYAELVAAGGGDAQRAVAGNLCPKCEGRPVAGVLRVEGDAGKRFLLCAFCGTEWEFRRILCAYCGETREPSLPVFVAEKFPHIRVEACDTCRHFLRTVDLTKDGNAVPVVDDLAAIPLALWADEHGYTRIRGNLLGT